MYFLPFLAPAAAPKNYAFATSLVLYDMILMRDVAAVAIRSHKPEVVGSIPTPASKFSNH